MLKELNTDEAPEQSQWLSAFWKGEPFCATSGDLDCSTLTIVVLNSFCFPQISAGVSCPSSPTNSAASIRAWHSASCRIKSPRRRRAVRPFYLCTDQISSASHSPDLTGFWSPQLSVAQGWQPISALTTSNVWSCIQGAWWTTTSSWT